MPPIDQSRLEIEEFAILNDRGVLLETNSPGMLRVSTSFLMSNAATSRLPTRTVSIHLPIVTTQTDQSVEIPTILHSVETLVHIGFQDSTAVEIFKRYQNRPSSSHDREEFIKYVETAVGKVQDSLDDPARRNLADNEVLERIGIKQATIDAVLDPEYATDCGTTELEDRLMKLLRTNYDTLSELLSTLKSQAILFIALARHEERLKIHDPTDNTSSSASVPDLVHDSD